MVSRRVVGRVVQVAAVVAALTCLLGAVVAWHLLGNLRDRSEDSLELVRDALVNVDDTLAVAEDVTSTVARSLDTLRSSIETVAASVEDAGTTLDVVADLTEDIPPNLDRIDDALGGLSGAAGVVDDVLEGLDEIPFGPDYDGDDGLAAAVERVRDDLRPVAEDLRASTGSIRELSASSEELITQLGALEGDLDELDASLSRSSEFLARYRANAAEGIAIATDSLADVDRDVTAARVLVVILATAIAVGQLAPYHVGRHLTAPSTAP